eukprot:CAMPEP_0198737208 /NCGR_PEP_ID=MMETSP1475-20131203/67748_1 /TAXON_ID= ORGANISM="Unidentified sp., Strain CCMP1999" /NCGR_SAMPLE_ID=MMETSP1475 /ASSEMBLY_ACC=CAM_ASM_001111 /LENGTH=231 /DNA_ID=CAMNT_0044501067 /DNA_START=94 /DNA_END=789 /DNA_ORIENTATION=+
MVSETVTSRDGLACERPEPNVVVLKLSRPQVRNCINDALYAALAEALRGISKDESVLAVIFTGEGEYFSSGVDVADAFNTSSDDRRSQADRPVGQFMLAVIECPKLLIAAVNGPAVGIGTTLLLHVDLVFALPQAWFWVPFLRAGIVPEFGSSMLLPKLLGPADAGRMLLLGDKMSCQEAHQRGLVGEIVQGSPSDLLRRCLTRLKAAYTGVPHGTVVRSVDEGVQFLTQA